MVFVPIVVVALWNDEEEELYFSSSSLVKLSTSPQEDILNGNCKQLRGGKGNAAQQETTNFIYMITRREIAQRTDSGAFKIPVT